MSEQTPERRRQIIDAALRVFARHGFTKATIKQIAAEGGLRSPALIYWYFQNKQELFQAVLAEHSPLISLAGRHVDLSAILERPPEEVLPLIAHGYLQSFDSPDAVRLFRLLLSEVARSPEVVANLAQAGVIPVMTFVVSYLQRQIEVGRLRRHDPQASARSFMGSLFIYLFNREILTPLEGLPDPNRYVEQVVSLFLDGLRA